VANSRNFAWSLSQNTNILYLHLIKSNHTSIVRFLNRSESLLTGWVPEQSLRCDFSTLIGLDFEVNSNRSYVLLHKLILGLSSQKRSFSHIHIPYKNNFKSHFIVFYVVAHIYKNDYNSDNLKNIYYNFDIWVSVLNSTSLNIIWVN